MGIRFSYPNCQKKPESTEVENNRKIKSSTAGGKSKSRAGSSKYEKFCGATNPFIIFFLRLRSKKSNIPVTTIARIAGKRWSQMTAKQRQKYIDLANDEKKRRQKIKKKRLHQVINSKKLRSRKKSVCKK